MNYLHISPARYSRILIPIFTLFITLSLPAGKGYASGINVEGLGVRAMSMGGAFVG